MAAVGVGNEVTIELGGKLQLLCEDHPDECAERLQASRQLLLLAELKQKDPHLYELKKYVGLNERTCLNQKPIVQVGEKVTKAVRRRRSPCS